MESSRWLEFVSSKIRSQISFENARKAENWAVAFLAFLALGGALSAVGTKEAGSQALYASKVLFLILFHAMLALGIFLPAVLQKGQRPLAKLFGVRDLTSLFTISFLLTFYAMVTFHISWQALRTQEAASSHFFQFVIWSNTVPIFFYMALGIWGFSALAFWPSALVKLTEKGGRAFPFLLGTHLVFLLLLALAYTEITAIGSPNFFEHLRVAGLFWVFVAGSVFLTGRLLEPSVIQPLSTLELEIVSNRLDRPDPILARYKDIFISPRFDFWVRQVSRAVSGHAHEIAAQCHEAVSLVSREKPSEIDLRQVEDRYRKAEARYRKLDKQNSRFLFNFALWSLNEAEQQKAESLRDQFSKELRNAKLEIAGVRKRIDERLIALRPLMQPVSEVVSEELTTTSR